MALLLKNMKKAKAYLTQLYNLNDNINQNIKKLERLRDSMLNVSGMDYSKDRVQTTPKDRMSAEISEYVDLNNHINNLIDEYVRMKTDIIQMIRGMPNRDHRRVLYKRYIAFKTISQVAAELHKSKRWVFLKQVDALKAFETQYIVYSK